LETLARWIAARTPGRDAENHDAEQHYQRRAVRIAGQARQGLAHTLADHPVTPVASDRPVPRITHTSLARRFAMTALKPAMACG
jgi:hypothetical protein